ncbi:hypothetical protein MPSEU_000882200 [Mayamaea pseudoterrestris]|nr:hypothetical protein MPSEU_000882200 [Mayamaea pseudoterrestris]
MVALVWWRPICLFCISPAFRTSSRRAARAFARAQATCRATTAKAATAIMTTSPSSSTDGYLDADSAFKLDQELMTQPGFTLEQLMELAGLSVAEAVYQVLQERQRLPHGEESSDKTIVSSTAKKPQKPHVLVICGPGNNGGDGLVAARHLVMFEYDATVLYPKQSSKQPHYGNLVQQCLDVGIKVHSDISELDRAMDEYDCIIDAIFGFSFQGEPRDPFKNILQQIQQAQNNRKVLTVSVDVPSGWNVDQGDISKTGFMPDVLVSLTAPKLSAKYFHGRHFVGGRFLPFKLADKYKIAMPPYPGVAQVVEVANDDDDDDEKVKQ